MTVLVGGLRVLGANVGSHAGSHVGSNVGGAAHGVFTHLLDMGTVWSPSATDPGVLEGRSRATGALQWTGTAADLVFGSNAQLRAGVCGHTVRPCPHPCPTR